ncbi:MAG: DUF192 domain-containing protein [Elusimicrobia bacterium]|nr:DUF192 domain-containing protein [Elusimicrobiota bacterium]
MIAFNKTNGKIVAGNVKKAENLRDRLLGLIPRASMDKSEGLFLKPCSSIHTCFMKFAIDAVFLDENMKVIAIVNSMKPWRFSKWHISASSVLELKAGVSFGKISEGDEIEII